MNIATKSRGGTVYCLY